MKKEKDFFIDVEKDSYIDGLIVANSSSAYIDIDLFISENFDIIPITNNSEKIEKLITEYGATPEEGKAIQKVADSLSELIALRIRLGNFRII